MKQAIQRHLEEVGRCAEAEKTCSDPDSESKTRSAPSMYISQPKNGVNLAV